VIKKLNVTILVASNMKERDLLEINQFRRVKKLEAKMQCNLVVSTFDDSEDLQKVEKFISQVEMTPIENNFPFKMHVP